MLEDEILILLEGTLIGLGSVDVSDGFILSADPNVDGTDVSTDYLLRRCNLMMRQDRLSPAISTIRLLALPRYRKALIPLSGSATRVVSFEERLG